MSQANIELREKFLYTLDWLLAVPSVTLPTFNSAWSISILGPRITGRHLRRQEAAHRLDEILDCMKQAFRKTDLVARDGVDFWLLVPFTQASEQLADKIREIVSIASQNHFEIVERDISVFSLPFNAPELNQDCPAEEFLAYLKKNHIRLASHAVVLPPEK